MLTPELAELTKRGGVMWVAWSARFQENQNG